MNVPDGSTIRWRKSSRSSGQVACVEVAFTCGWVLVRHSKDPGGPRLRFTPEEWLAFVEAACDGEFHLE